MKVMVLAGGTGTGLWPVSRIYYPKQFVKLNGENSIFQKTILGCVDAVKIEDIIIVTNIEYKYFVLDQLNEISISIPESNIIFEPIFKNTLHAVSVGVFSTTLSQNKYDDFIVIPSNGLVSDYGRIFNNYEYFKVGNRLNNIILFGMDATGVYTGYGYIKAGAEDNSLCSVEDFIEKPAKDKVDELIKNGYLYNSGVLFFNSRIFLDELQLFYGDLYNVLKENRIDDAYKLDVQATVEKGILEKTKKLSVIHLKDVIEKDNIYSEFYKQYNVDKDEFGNKSFNDNVYINAKNNLVYAENNKVVSVVGCDDLIVIDQPDALLVCNKNHTEKVRDVASILKDRGDDRAEYHTTCYRPWGSYTVLEEGVGYKIKRITVYSDKKLSYQMHYHRSEHWVVVTGTAIVNKEGKEIIIRQGESVFISAGEKHRLENRGKCPLEVIEVQIGNYLGEDDIVRYDDDFGRGE